MELQAPESKNGDHVNMPPNWWIGRLFIGPRCPWGPIYGSGCLKLSEPPFADLTDVTLADEDTNSILMLIMPIGQSKAMQMTKPGEKICN